MGEENIASRQVLEETPGRALTFLRAIGTNASIRAILASNGYTAKDHEEGWRLLLRVSGYLPPAAAEQKFEGDTKVRAAIAELDAWDEQGFRRAHAALGRLHPEQDRAVFDGLTATKGPEAILRVAKFLDRIDAFEKGSKADKEALKTLATRGIDANERARLRELLKIAQSSPSVTRPDESAHAEREDLTSALVEIRAWFEDWSETARAVVARRDHLIRLGLARRKARKQDDADPSAEPASADE
jgi:hypothetical protein